MTNTRIVGIQVAVKRDGAWAGARGKILEIQTFLLKKPRDGPVGEAVDQTSNRSSVMNFYGLVLGLFKDFLLWFENTIAAVCLCVPGLPLEKARGAH